MLPWKVHQHTCVERRRERDFYFDTHCTQTCYMSHIIFCHLSHHVTYYAYDAFLSDKVVHSERLSCSLSDNMKRDVCD